MNKVQSVWLAPNRCEDVIVIKLSEWSRYDEVGVPLRRLRVLYFYYISLGSVSFEFDISAPLFFLDSSSISAAREAIDMPTDNTIRLRRYVYMILK